MANHITARLAWHDDGWNGKICRHPGANVYCVGERSFLGRFIPENRSLSIEEKFSGMNFEQIQDYVPPCASTSNAFGEQSVAAYSNPPEFFRSTKAKRWVMPPASVCVWPYEEMYTDAVKTDGKYDNGKRRESAAEFFRKVEPGKSLIFYHANYSNPFSGEGTNC
ncbi:MAG: exonuclease, partial [Firmicutes bacterium]|nr:exonuclease [Bacillota bacterium]